MTASPRMLKHSGAALVLLLALTATGCNRQTVAPEATTPATTTTTAATDLLGAKPTLAAAKPFSLPAPVIFTAPGGFKVWLLERRALPLVAVTLSLPFGAADDPPGEAGLAHITAQMLQEGGAGKRNAIELSSAINDLGAELATSAGTDGSFASLLVLKRSFAEGFALFADVVARPRFDKAEWQRTRDLWLNDLAKRGDDPEEVASVVAPAALYGQSSPYGHPVDGLLAEARRIELSSVQAFYKSTWRPDQALLVVVGDINQAELTAAIARELSTWKAPSIPPPFRQKVVDARWKPPRLVLVDRPGAPQSVLALVRDGVAAAEPHAAMLDLINTALGGSFTSRLNQNLREEHSWTYGAHSRFTETRDRGAFVVRTAVDAEVTGPALKEILGELKKMAGAGLSDVELAKVQAQDRARLVETYETAQAAAARLADLASLGLAPEFDATASASRQKTTLAELVKLAAAVDPTPATIVIVGPAAQVRAQIAALELGEPAMWTTEGRPAK